MVPRTSYHHKYKMALQLFGCSSWYFPQHKHFPLQALIYFFPLLLCSCYLYSLYAHNYAKCLIIHTWSETFQGVEFTEISCGIGGATWSWWDGITRRCRGFRATVSCANEGRKFGSLKRGRGGRKMSNWRMKCSCKISWNHLMVCGRKKWIKQTLIEHAYCCQHSQIILATIGSTSFGISSLRFWKPTAPTTCIVFISLHGNLRVASSHRMTPKL